MNKFAFEPINILLRDNLFKNLNQSLHDNLNFPFYDDIYNSIYDHFDVYGIHGNEIRFSDLLTIQLQLENYFE